MAEKNFAARVTQKHDTYTNWQTNSSFVPKAGELIIYDADATHESKFKVGDGTTTVGQLPFINQELPSVTTLDNGKVLGVDNGQWDIISVATTTGIDMTESVNPDGGTTIEITTGGEGGGGSGGGGGSVTVDNALSDSSVNPVQNQVIKAALDGKVDIDQGTSNAGKVLKVGSNGNVSLETIVQVPSVSSSDNGKVLRVVNGAWQAVSLPSASGVSF